MTAPKNPREGCAWTDARVDQFKTLELLISTLSALDNGSNFIRNLQNCIAAAKQLEKWDFGSDNTSFLQFLRTQIIEDRFGEGDK